MLMLALVLGVLSQAPAEPRRAPDLVDLTELARVGVAGARPVLAGGAVAAMIHDVEPAVYVVDAAPRSRVVYLLPPGPKTIRELVVEPTSATSEAWRVARLRLIWESDDPAFGPGVDLPLGLLFGRFASGAGLGANLLAQSDGPAWLCRFPMPYRTQAILEVHAERPIAGRIRLRWAPGVAPGTGYFRAAVASRRTGPVEAGRGRLAGVIVLGGLAPDGQFAPEASLGRLMLDGRDEGPLARAVGLPLRSDMAGSMSHGVVLGDGGEPSAAFRWLTGDPLAYDRAMAVEPAPGREAAVQRQKNGNGDEGGPSAARAVVFWYADRPRAGATPPIPGVGPGPGGR